MKGAVFAVLATGVAFAAVTAVTPRVAHAQKQKIIVEQFGGPSSDKLRNAVEKAVGKAGADVVADKKVAAVEADLGLMQTSDAYGAVAKELKANGFVGGSVAPGKHAKARVVVHDANGNVVGEASWTGANPGKAVSAAEGDLAGKISDWLGKLKDGGGAAAASNSPPPEAAPAADDAPKKSKRKKKDEVAESAAPASESTSSDSKNSDASVAASASSADEPSSSNEHVWSGLDLQVGVHAYSRNFTYNDKDQNGNPARAGNQQEYKLNLGPALALAADYFFIPYVGITVSGEYSFGLLSQMSDGSSFKTASYMGAGGLKGKYHFGAIELNGSLTYGVHHFSVDADNPQANNAPHVAPVQYSVLSPSVGTRITVAPAFAIIAGAGYLQVLDPGGIKTDYFPGATAKGVDGFAGIALALPALMKGFEARAMIDFRRYVFAMNSITADLQQTGSVSGGAVDQYIGFTVAAALRPNAR